MQRATRKHRKIIQKKKKSGNITWAKKEVQQRVGSYQKEQNRNPGAKEYSEC